MAGRVARQEIAPMSANKSKPFAKPTDSAKPLAGVDHDGALLERALDALLGVAGGKLVDEENIASTLEAMITEQDGIPPEWEKGLRLMAPITNKLKPPAALSSEREASLFGLSQSELYISVPPQLGFIRAGPQNHRAVCVPTRIVLPRKRRLSGKRNLHKSLGAEGCTRPHSRASTKNSRGRK